MTKARHFYSHLVQTESVYIELDSLDMTDEQKKHLIQVFESTMHHHVLDTILSELNEEDKKQFVSHLEKDDHESVWNVLKSAMTDAEKKIKTVKEELIIELRNDIKRQKA